MFRPSQPASQQQLHSVSTFQRALDDLDGRLGDCDGLLAALSHCVSEAKRSPGVDAKVACREVSTAFYECNKAKTQRHSAMRSVCSDATAAFDGCMQKHCTEPETCLDTLTALVACCEKRGVFSA